MISYEEVIRRSEAAGGKRPLLTLAEFFAGNTQEDSIAPNQWGPAEEGGCDRPPLAEIHRRLVELEACSDVAWVRVQLHEDTFDGDSVSAESIAICTTSKTDEIERRLRAIDELGSDGVMEGLSYDEKDFCDMPHIPAGHRLTSLVWD
ncbi:hypothetical protein [Thauera sp.]|uniref:hypothetical protein n=1 Tax=Thauera sp. TaxID=1905334 RepID=UPI0039E6634D